MGSRLIGRQARDRCKRRRLVVRFTSMVVFVSLVLGAESAVIGAGPADPQRSPTQVQRGDDRDASFGRSAADGSSTARACPPEMPSPCIGSPPTAKEQVRKFKKRKIGYTHKIHIPKKVKRKIHRKWRKRHRDASRADWDNWWGGFVSRITCFGGQNWHCAGGNGGFPTSDAKDLLKDTGKVGFACGGAAVIGFAFRGGWWGAGAGAAGCLWTKLIATW